ncbi:uncharacterized protein [Miscanthus floridulus]|uniref:uncharacterized protein n=1 Tax=Miscanthus floridulus TaxID=154761 RepID=UPI0034584E5E
METAAVLTIHSTSHVCLQCPAVAAPAHGQRRRGGVASAAAAMPRRQPCAGRIRALPSAEVISEILSPKLVPGSPSDTGDVSSLVPVSALMLLFYFVSNWVVPELLMKRLNEPKLEDEAAAAAASMSSGPADGIDASPRKIRLKVKKKKNGKATIVKV